LIAMTALYVSFVVVALAEMGDKTQLVALTLASRYRRPWTVILGILIATLVNHALAASIGGWMAEAVPRTWLAWTLGSDSSRSGSGPWCRIER
jgi:Ca2+/H+ antiporter, TMEM165/GDT1 family